MGRARVKSRLDPIGQREANEEHMDGDAVKLSHVFRHNRFRRYGS